MILYLGADQNLRDWSGRKPRQYQISLDNAVSADTFRSKCPAKHVSVPQAFLIRRESRRDKAKFPRRQDQTISMDSWISFHFWWWVKRHYYFYNKKKTSQSFCVNNANYCLGIVLVDDFRQVLVSVFINKSLLFFNLRFIHGFATYITQGGWMDWLNYLMADLHVSVQGTYKRR